MACFHFDLRCSALHMKFGFALLCLIVLSSSLLVESLWKQSLQSHTAAGWSARRNPYNKRHLVDPVGPADTIYTTVLIIGGRTYRVIMVRTQMRPIQVRKSFSFFLYRKIAVLAFYLTFKTFHYTNPRQNHKGYWQQYYFLGRPQLHAGTIFLTKVVSTLSSELIY